MARQWIWILGSVVTGLTVGWWGGWLKPEVMTVQPESYSQSAQPVASTQTLNDERPWPPIPTPPPPLPSPQPRPIPVPRTEGIPQPSSYRFEQGHTVNPALYQAAVDAFVEQMIGWGYDTHGILIALPDGTELASFGTSQSFASPLTSRLTTSLEALQLWGSDSGAIALLPLLQEMHLRVGDPSLISDKILTTLSAGLTQGQDLTSLLHHPFWAALMEISEVQPLAPLDLVTTPQSLMRTLQALEAESGTVSQLLPAGSGIASDSAQANPVITEDWATPLTPPTDSYPSEPVGHVMVGQLPDQTLFVLINTGSSQQQIQQMQHRLLMTLTDLR